MVQNSLARIGVLTTFLMAALSGAPRAHAYYATLDTGGLLAAENYRLGVSTQFITEGDDGINLAARMDGPINDELNWRGLVGFGTTDAFLGAFVKWVPFPDTDSQPAVGLLGGLLYARYSDLNELALRAHPFVSKEFKLELGDLTPFASLPLGLRQVESDTDFTAQIAFGAELRPDTFEKIRFLAEIGFDLSEALPYFAIAANLEFDEENGIEFK